MGADVALETLTRADLNARAAELGVEAPEKLKTKAAVLNAISDHARLTDLRDTAPEDGPEPPATAEKPSRPGRDVYVAVESLSWRPHPLPRGSEVSEILPASVIETGLEDGRLTREKP